MLEHREPEDREDAPTAPAAARLGTGGETASASVAGAPLVVAEGLVKDFGALRAVDSLSFQVQPKDFLGFLGPNGAGKTTLMKMVYCSVQPSSGGLTVFGEDVLRGQRQIKARLGVVPQENNLDPDLSVWDNLMVYGRYFGLAKPSLRDRARDLLGFMELWEKRDVIIEKLSGGMKRRLVIARALINEPHLVVLDEPTTGLDPQVRHLIWDRLLELRSQGLTFMLTTHYMDEAESLCDRLLIMDKGHFVAGGRPLDLVRRFVGEFVLELQAGQALEEEIAAAYPGLERQRSGRRLYLFACDPDELTPLVKRFGGRDGRLRPASVEDVFLKLTGREIKE
jgi:lipooligosaccharide transport system ATP-binding protein